MSVAKILIACECVGSQAALARHVGASVAFVNQWATGRRPVPAEFCPKIERATSGAVRCEDLRPDIEWSVLRQSCDCQEAA